MQILERCCLDVFDAENTKELTYLLHCIQMLLMYFALEYRFLAFLEVLSCNKILTGYFVPKGIWYVLRILQRHLHLSFLSYCHQGAGSLVHEQVSKRWLEILRFDCPPRIKIPEMLKDLIYFRVIQWFLHNLFLVLLQGQFIKLSAKSNCKLHTLTYVILE